MPTLLPETLRMIQLSSQSPRDEIDITLRRLDASLGFLLEGMQNINGFAKAYRVNRPIGVTVKVPDRFNQTAAKSTNRVSGCRRTRKGPQIGYIFPLGTMQGYLNLKGYGEFDARDRPSGYNVWLTFAISPEAPTSTTPAYHK